MLIIYLNPNAPMMDSRSTDCYIDPGDCSNFPKVKKLHLRFSEQSGKMFWDENFFLLPFSKNRLWASSVISGLF